MYYKMFEQSTDDEDINAEREKIVDDFTSFLLSWSLDRAIEIDGQFYPREFFNQDKEESDEPVKEEVVEEADAKVIQLHDKQ